MGNQQTYELMNSDLVPLQYTEEKLTFLNAHLTTDDVKLTTHYEDNNNVIIIKLNSSDKKILVA